MAGTIRLGLVLLVLVAVNVYVLFFGSGSLSKVRDAAREAVAGTGAQVPAGDAAAAPTPAATPVAPLRVVTGKIRDGEGLGSALRRERIPAPDSDAVLRSLGPLMDFRKEIRAGQKYVVKIDEAGRLVSFELRARDASYVVARDAAGNLIARTARTPQH